uniref:CHCH domain-containing protein n=1 Tax=Graphocephala atropunctata TaxID=36148 RepID=A0A1B6KCT5_9HEMI
MGLGSSKTRKIHIENPESGDARTSEANYSGGKGDPKVAKVIQKNAPPKRLAFMPRFENAESQIRDLRGSFLRNNVSNSSSSAIGFGKEEFERMYQDVERYFTFTNENTLRDYEIPCKVIKEALKECLTIHNQQPLHCGEEVSNFVSCLSKCKLSQ